MSKMMTIFIYLVIFNLLTVHYAYYIYRNNELVKRLFPLYESNVYDEESLANLKRTTEYNSVNNNNNNNDNYYFICQPKSTHILCVKFDTRSRRDTGFLRFGRKQ